MTIKDFSRLCGCNPQTLRYYDRIGLLKPLAVDLWTGYRHYKEEQALAYVKIKNLQRAGFSIEEIRPLLSADDAQICRAIDAKITETETLLREIKQIKQSYQAEITAMKNMLEKAQELVLGSMADYNPKEEFGLSEAEYEDLKEKLEGLFNRAAEDSGFSKFEYSCAEDDEAEFEKLLQSPDFSTVFEKHGWENVKDFFDMLPAINPKKEYLMLFRVSGNKTNKTAFANTFVSLVCSANPGKTMNLGCNVIESADGENSFYCLESK